MYTFLRMGVIDFKNRMKMYDYCIIIFNLIRPLRVGRKERSDGIASKQVRLVRASVTIISYFHKDEISPLRYTSVEMTKNN